MIDVIIENSMSRVVGLTDTQFKALRNVLSYSIDSQAAYLSSAYQTKRYLLSKKGEFPTGLLYLVKESLSKTPSVRYIDRRALPKPRHGLFAGQLGHEPYVEQIEASKAARRANRGIVVAPTGVGKSAIATLIVNELQVPTLIVVPSLELKRQLTEGMQKAFGKARVGGLGCALAIENVDALDPDKPLKGYDCVIIDEFHHSAAKTYRNLNKYAWKDVYHRFGLTATPFRTNKEEKLLLESILSEVIYKINHDTAVARGYIVPVEAYFINLPKREIQGNEMSWPSMYSELVVHNDSRNLLIATMLQALQYQGKSTLCLVKEVKHGEMLSKMTGIPSASGVHEDTSEKLQAFNSKEAPGLIGTTGILGEGVDTKPCEYVIIAGLGKSRSAFMQQVGRGFRVYPGKESCKVILFRDPSHKWTLTHFRAQAKVLKEEYGIVPVEI